LFIPANIFEKDNSSANGAMSKFLLIKLHTEIVYLVNSKLISKYTPIPKNPSLDKNEASFGSYCRTIRKPNTGSPNKANF
jgi:hypothetical protein